MQQFLNPAIYGNWENWVRVYIMALIGFLAFDCAMSLLARKEVE